MTNPEPVTTPEDNCREFARHYPTRMVQAAIARAEAGDITWDKCERLFTIALDSGLTAARNMEAAR